MASHDVYLSSAVSDSSPATLIEAMGLGLIPICGDIPGIREWLQEDRGYVFDLYSADQLRNRIAALIDSGDAHGEMRERNLARVKESAIFEDNIAQTIAIMRELIEERKR
jgi:glycosyltransferase involved in cell wall biosynthesis